MVSAVAKTALITTTSADPTRWGKDDDAWGDDTECPICCDGPCTHTHSLCGRTYCLTCINTLPNCAFCRNPIRTKDMLCIPTPDIHGCVKLSGDFTPNTSTISEDVRRIADNIRIHTALPIQQRLCCSGDIDIFIKGLDDDDDGRVRIKSSLSISIQTLKACLAIQYGLSEEIIRLIYRGHPLIDAKTLRDHGIVSGDYLYFLLQHR